MSEEEIIVSAAGVSRRVIPPSEDRSDAEVTASGSELDALVAEYVFRRSPWPANRCGICGAPLRESVAEGCVADSCSLRPAPERRADATPPYSVDLSWAWGIVALMACEGYWCEMRSPWTADAGAPWWAGFTPHATTGWNGRPDHWHSGDTLPEAVCRAAVAALVEQRAFDERERAAQMAQERTHE